MQQAASLLERCGFNLGELTKCWLRKAWRKEESNSFSFNFSKTLGLWKQEVAGGEGWDLTQEIGTMSMSMYITNSVYMLFSWVLLSHPWAKVCFLQLIFLKVTQKSKDSLGSNSFPFRQERVCEILQTVFPSVASDSLGKLVNTPNLFSPSLRVSKTLVLWLGANVNHFIKETSICSVASVRGSSWHFHFSYSSQFEDSISIPWCLEQMQIHFSSSSLASFATVSRLVSIDLFIIFKA